MKAYRLHDVQDRRVDGETVKADTWYHLMDDKFTEVEG